MCKYQTECCMAYTDHDESECYTPEMLESSSSPGCSNVPTELDVAEDKIQELETLITVLRADIRELYSMRGEDELTAKYCNAILAATADI